MATRRTALVTIVGAAALPALAQTPPTAPSEPPAHDMESMLEGPPPSLPTAPALYFRGREYEMLIRLTDMIVPRTESPGAADAGVPWRIDQQVHRAPLLQQEFTHGFAYLNGEARNLGAPDFLALDETRQIAVLTSISGGFTTPESQFFRSLKNMTLDAYYRSYQGLVEELGFHGNTFRKSFIGCTHPEHWPS